MLAKIKSAAGALGLTSEKPSLQKAQLAWEMPDGGPTGKIECQFNPSTLSISKSVNWHALNLGLLGGKNTVPDLNAPFLFYGGGNPAEFSLDLIFDTTTLSNQDVRGFTNQLLALTLKGAGDPSAPEDTPPLVKFIWGEFQLFQAVIMRVAISYTLFLASGVPVRARAQVQFRQAFDGDTQGEGQNPTSRTDRRKTRLVQQGERLDYIAYQEYGDAGRWRDIAEANHLDNPLDLHAGQILVIPQD